MNLRYVRSPRNGRRCVVTRTGIAIGYRWRPLRLAVRNPAPRPDELAPLTPADVALGVAVVLIVGALWLWGL